MAATDTAQVDEAEEPPQPPGPPEVARRLAFHRTQLIGVPLILLIPLLAVLGLFGESRQASQAAGEALELQVAYPARLRYWMSDTIEVAVRNASDQPLSDVAVEFDRAYVESFSDVAFTPDVSAIDDAAYRVELQDLQPGETRRVSVDLRAEDYWSHRGSVSVVAGGGRGPAVTLDTLVFP